MRTRFFYIISISFINSFCFFFNFRFQLFFKFLNLWFCWMICLILTYSSPALIFKCLVFFKIVLFQIFIWFRYLFSNSSAYINIHIIGAFDVKIFFIIIIHFICFLVIVFIYNIISWFSHLWAILRYPWHNLKLCFLCILTLTMIFDLLFDSIIAFYGCIWISAAQVLVHFWLWIIAIWNIIYTRFFFTFSTALTVKTLSFIAVHCFCLLFSLSIKFFLPMLFLLYFFFMFFKLSYFLLFLSYFNSVLCTLLSF